MLIASHVPNKIIPTSIDLVTILHGGKDESDGQDVDADMVLELGFLRKTALVLAAFPFSLQLQGFGSNGAV